MQRIVTALVIVGALSLAGCSATSAEPLPSDVPSSSPSSAPSPSASPSSATPAAMPACLDLLDDTQVAQKEDPASGMVLNEWSGVSFDPTTMERIDAAGGATCIFGQDFTDNAIGFGYASTEGVGVDELRQYLTDSGYAETASDDGEMYCKDLSLSTEPLQTCNLLVDGRWFMSSQPLTIPGMEDRVAEFEAAQG